MRRINARQFWPVFAYPLLLLGISVIGVVVYLFAILIGSETWQVYAIAMIIGPIVVLTGLIVLFVTF